MAEAAGKLEFEAPTRKEIQRILARHDAVAKQRLAYIQDSLTWEQGEFLTLLPLLLHINHPALPGYHSTDVPAGIANYEPDRQALLSARQYANNLKKDRRAQRFLPILGLYLIGSSGTLGQDHNSDFDVWVCHHPDLNQEQLAALEIKTRLLEEHAAGLGLQAHFFILHAEGFRQRQHNALSDESSGNTQHHLLLEEFYRTGLLLAGRPPLWWIVPPEHLHDYQAYCSELLSKRFIREYEWLNFGGLDDIGAGEFFSAAHWQLFKGIHVPYKSLLKLLLFEAFASDFPRVNWVAEEANALYQGQQELSAIDVDPYLLMMRRIEKHLLQKGDPERLQLARRAFYIKSGAHLSRAREDWKTPLFRRLCSEWGWDEGEIINLDQLNAWKLNRVIEERNRLVGELTLSYRLLTAFARKLNTTAGIDKRELALLGRKLYSSLERRPGKIDRVNPGISTQLGQDEIWLQRDPGTGAWQCFGTEPGEHLQAAKTTASFVELLTWLSSNRVIDSSTRIDLPAGELGSHAQEHLHLVRLLRQHFPPSEDKPVSLSSFGQVARGQHALAIINALQKPVLLPDGLLRVSERSDPLSFGTQRLNLITQVEHVHSNNWGELHVSHHRGDTGLLDMLCRHLELFLHHRGGGSLACHCETHGHGATIANRLGKLADRLLAHFQEHGETARYILEIGEEYHVIRQTPNEFQHQLLGAQDSLMDYLGQRDEDFHPTRIDATGLLDSPLPQVLLLNRPRHTQICYVVEKRGIHAFLLDANGAVIEQFLHNGDEMNFLIHLKRFFNTLEEWRGPVDDAEASLQPEYIRLDRPGGRWRAQRIRPPQEESREYTELILSTGPKGPWKDGFSLTSGEREFNSVALGERVYEEAAAYLQGFRQGDRHYPFYLTGVITGELTLNPSFSVAELIRTKVHVEHQLNQAGRILLQEASGLCG